VKHSAIGNRLLSCAQFVRQGAYFADIGTDHAYLPLFLLKSGRIDRAVCADINAGPLESAKRNAADEGCLDKISFHLTDGAEGLSDLGITDYAICGMGGELISAIISRAPHLLKPGTRLILQPMTKQAHLRRFLAESGFFSVGESYSYEAGKYYLALAVEFDGVRREISDFEAEIGKFENSPEARGYFETKINALKKAMQGKLLSGEKSDYERRIIDEYNDILGGFNNDGK
jgi:tRNA (adenine22-N1)-methyltransferase